MGRVILIHRLLPHLHNKARESMEPDRLRILDWRYSGNERYQIYDSAGHRLALNSAVAGGVLISAMVVVEIYMLKQRKGMDVEMNNEMTEQMVREQRKKYSEIRPDLFTSDGRIKLKRA